MISIKKTIPIMSIILTLSFGLFGCAGGNYGKQITKVNYYPQCYSSIQALRDADSSFNTTVVASTGIGVALGALTGALVSGDWRGAVVGGVVGGVAGAGIGYTKAKQDRITDDNQRMASYLVDIQGDISGLDRASAAAKVAQGCYDNQFVLLIETYKKGGMSKSELQSRYSEIKSGSQEAANVLGSVIAGANKKEEEYQAALVSESEKANVSVPAPVTTSTASGNSQKPTATATAPKPKSSGSQPKASGNNSLQAVADGKQDFSNKKQEAVIQQANLNQGITEKDKTINDIMKS